MLTKKSVEDINVTGKKVLVRCDFNVPMEDGRITDDNRIDVSLQQTGLAQVKSSAETLLALLHDNGGFLPLNDASAPEEVAARTQMSKKVFKRSLGMLLKRGEVEMTEQGIKLRKGK